MQESKYDPIQLSQDANEFATSRFGIHYLKRLEALKGHHLDAAMNLSLSDSTRAHRASQAATYDAEIEYFTIARTIQETPTLMKRLRKKIKGKEVEDDIDV